MRCQGHYVTCRLERSPWSVELPQPHVVTFHHKGQKRRRWKGNPIFPSLAGFRKQDDDNDDGDGDAGDDDSDVGDEGEDVDEGDDDDDDGDAGGDCEHGDDGAGGHDCGHGDSSDQRIPFLVEDPDKKRSSLLELSMKYANRPDNNSPFRPFSVQNHFRDRVPRCTFH